MDKELIFDPPKQKKPAWFHGLLTHEDFEIINPHRAKFIAHLQVQSAFYLYVVVVTVFSSFDLWSNKVN